MYKWLLQVLKRLTDPRHMSPREIFYNMALTYIGTDASPNDLAPDELGCAECINNIHNKAFGRPIAPDNQLSTYYLRKALKNDLSFLQVQTPEAGTIIISATGYGGQNGVKHGHVGIFCDDKLIASNDSRTGTFEINYNLGSWNRYYKERGGYEVLFFNKI